MIKTTFYCEDPDCPRCGQELNEEFICEDKR